MDKTNAKTQPDYLDDNRGYAGYSTDAGGEAISFLIWQEESDQLLNYDFTGVFPEEPLVTYWPDQPYPQFDFLWDGKQFDKERIGRAFDELGKDDVDGSGKIKPESQERIFQIHNRLERQLERDAKRLGHVFKYAKLNLKVLVYEAAQALSEEAISQLHHAAERLWRNTRFAVDSRRIEEDLRRFAKKYDLPSSLAEQQISGFMYLLGERDKVLASSTEIHDRWWVYEQFVQAALRNKPAPGAKALIREAAQQDRRVVHKQHKDWVANRYHSLKDSGNYHSESKIIQKVQQDYLDEFGDEISDRTVRRYRD